MPTSVTGSRTAELGFTLVELMVVLVILGLMSAVVVLAIPDQRSQVRGEAERFAARALAVRDDAIVQGRTMSLRIGPQGYSVERRAQGQWQAAGGRALAIVRWTPGTGISTTQSRVSFDSVGSVETPAAVDLTRDGATARVEFPADGSIHVAR